MPIHYLCPIESPRDLKDLIDTVKPDLRVQGYEYKDHISRFPVKKMFCRGGSVKTSEIIDRILKRYARP